jgi:serine protease Do
MNSIVGLSALLVGWTVWTTSLLAQPPLTDLARDAQSRVVKIYGAGGLSGLEAYQSGFLVSPEGHVATTWSYVLDVEPVIVLDDGRRFDGKIVGFEPHLELAVVKIEASGLPYFSVAQGADVKWGDSVVAVSNVFGIASGDEPASMMQGNIAAITELDARRGTFKTPYRGKVLVLDLVANNPGAGGGALVSSEGKLVGMIGKELRDSATGVWLNYALPVDALRPAIGDIIAGRKTTAVEDNVPLLPREQAHAFATLGIIMIPDVLEGTPTFVDDVMPDGPASKADLRPDDLVLLAQGKRVADQRALRELLRTIDRRDAVELTIQRGTEILPVTIRP